MGLQGSTFIWEQSCAQPGARRREGCRTAVGVPYGSPKNSPYIDIVLCLHVLVLWDCRVQLLFGNIIVLNQGLGGVRDVASAIISHEQTQSNRVCCFQTLDAVIPKGLFSDYFFYRCII